MTVSILLCPGCNNSAKCIDPVSLTVNIIVIVVLIVYQLVLLLSQNIYFFLLTNLTFELYSLLMLIQENNQIRLFLQYID